MGHSRPLFDYFCLFKQTLQFLQQINVKKFPSTYGAGIRTHDLSNMRLETPPKTTRPWLPSVDTKCCFFRFIAVMHADNDGVIPGNALVVDPKKQFRPLSKFGNSFLNRFQCSNTNSEVLKGIERFLLQLKTK